MKLTKKTQKPEKLTRTQRLEKLIRIATTIAVFDVAFAIPAFAGDIGSVVTSMGGVLKTILTITGGGILVFGVVHLVQAQANQDPNAKSQGFLQIGVGAGLVAVANTLIPVLQTFISTQMGK